MVYVQLMFDEEGTCHLKYGLIKVKNSGKRNPEGAQISNENRNHLLLGASNFELLFFSID